jgi:ankyrin repeat protein|tara:strand:- start:439 stop:573 length:135 start_codon:yes stop_codon:yes gene_type:complete
MPFHIHTNSKGYTALMMAAAYNQHPCAAKLLASGANMSARASGE